MSLWTAQAPWWGDGGRESSQGVFARLARGLLGDERRSMPVPKLWLCWQRSLCEVLLPRCKTSQTRLVVVQLPFAPGLKPRSLFSVEVIHN